MNLEQCIYCSIVYKSEVSLPLLSAGCRKRTISWYDCKYNDQATVGSW